MKILSKIKLSGIKEIGFNWVVNNQIEREDDDDSLIDFEFCGGRVDYKNNIGTNLKIFLIKHNTIIDVIRRIQAEGSYGFGMFILFNNIDIVDSDDVHYHFNCDNDHTGLDVLSDIFRDVNHHV